MRRYIGWFINARRCIVGIVYLRYSRNHPTTSARTYGGTVANNQKPNGKETPIYLEGPELCFSGLHLLRLLGR